MKPSIARSPLFLPCLAIALLATLIFFMWRLDPGTQHSLSREHGPIETISVSGYLAVALSLAVAGGVRFVKRHWYFPAIIVAMGLRELDFDKRFTTMGILKSSFYLSADVPIAEKMAGLAVVGILAVAAALMLRRHFGAFLRGLRALRPDAFAIGMAAVFALVSKTIDGAGRKLAAIDIAIGETLSARIAIVEEMLELGIPLMLALAVHGHFRQRPAVR